MLISQDVSSHDVVTFRLKGFAVIITFFIPCFRTLKLKKENVKRAISMKWGLFHVYVGHRVYHCTTGQGRQLPHQITNEASSCKFLICS